jgi:GT2 family glycosyltransferase
MTQPLVSIGLVTWNSAACLTATLEALAQQSYPDFEIVVVDNASNDDSVNRARSYLPNAQLILNHENRGFCGGHNQAIRASHGIYYMALNPDVVMNPNYISALVDALESRPECGSAAGKLLQAPGIIDSTGLVINRRRQQYLRGHGELDLDQYDQPNEIFGVDGAAPLYRMAMLQAASWQGEVFDESFFAYKEDVDLAWRARLLGWSSCYVPNAIAIHPRTFRPGQDGGGRRDLSRLARLHSIKNRYLLLIKNESSAGWRRDWARILFYDLKILGYLVLLERDSLPAFGLLRKAWARAQAWRTYLWRQVQVSPSALLEWFQ